MIHDPHCPAPEMCSECLEMFPDDSHACADPEKGSLWPVVLLLAILWCLIAVLGWSLWTALKYGGWVR